jgi:hypothetical protein
MNLVRSMSAAPWAGRSAMPLRTVTTLRPNRPEDTTVMPDSEKWSSHISASTCNEYGSEHCHLVPEWH